MAQVKTNRKQGLFLHELLVHLHTENTQTKLQTKRSMEDIMENDYMFVMLCNLSVISQWIFPQCFFFYFWRQI